MLTLISALGSTSGCADLVGANFDVTAREDAGATGGIGGTSGASGSSGAGSSGSAGSAGSAGASECPLSLPGPPLIRVGAGDSGLCIDATEVTRAQYAAFLDAGGPTASMTGCSWKSSWAPSCEDPQSSRDALPVVCVDWCDAAAFCSWAGKRLCGGRNGLSVPPADADKPSRDQWSFACMSGPKAHSYVYGDTFDGGACNGTDREGTGCTAGGSCQRTSAGTIPSCQSPEKGFKGVLDLIGNVAEWEDSCVAPPGSDDPSLVTCLVRGGSVHDGSSATCAQITTSLARNAAFPVTQSLASTGFRCCL
jgi:formylglycine-generating enzyme required for sulfatase activity